MLLLLAFIGPRRRYFKHSTSGESTSSYERNFTQLVDHFDSINAKTFYNRYFINEQFYKPEVSTVLVLDIGGEAANSDASVTGRYTSYYLAQRFDGVLASLEHRFYGTSNFETEQADLQFLTSKQAIADYAEFIPYLKQKYNLTKVIAVGGSYSASLAVWMRAQIPHLVDAALASSGPLVAKFEFSDYLDHVQAQFNQEAQDLLKSAYEIMDDMIQRNECKEICDIFGIAKCDFESELDKITLAEALVDPIAGLVYYSKAALWDGKQESSDIAIFVRQIKACKSVQEIMTIMAYYVDFSNYKTYDELVAAFYRPGEDDGRLWSYQTCREFGFYQAASSPTTIFPSRITADYFVHLCLDAFYAPMGMVAEGDFSAARSLNQAVIDAVNFQEYGARNVPRDKIYYTAGAVDPWTELAMSGTLGWDKGEFRAANTRLEIIPHGSHCSDLYLDWVINEDVRARQVAAFAEWLNLAK